MAIGLAIRELLAPWTGHPYDFEIWTRLGVFMQSLQNPYTSLPYQPGVSFAPYPTTGSISYPPFSAFLFGAIFGLYRALGEPSRFLYYFLLKQPIIISDTVTAIVLFRIVVQSKSPGPARTVLLAWLYFPLSILVSGVWGALDPIALVMMLLAAYFFLNQKIGMSATFLGLGIFVKTLPIVALPVFLMQAGTNWIKRLLFLAISLIIPTIGTLTPILALNWGFSGFLKNSSFQTTVPVYGAMSVFTALLLLPSIPGILHLATELLWIPALFSALVYVRVRKLQLFSGLLVAILGFSLFRPFLSEQWAIYPLGFLLAMVSEENLRHYFGLATSALIFLFVNNTFLERFLSPISLGFFNWNAMVTSLPSYLEFTGYTLPLLAGLFFVEALLTMSGRDSFVYRALAAAGSGLRVQLIHSPRILTTHE